MFSDISFATYGRRVRNQEWYLENPNGINRLYYINSGSVLYKSEKTTKELISGQVYLFPQNLSFNLITDKNTKVDHHFLDFYTLPVIRSEEIIQFNPTDYPMIKSALDTILNLIETYPMYPKYKHDIHYRCVKSALNVLIILINDEFPVEVIDNIAIANTIKYIHKNFCNELSVEALAQNVHLEKNYFIKLFKKYMNTTPYKYIMNYRMKLARSLINENKYTIAEIAEITGYSDHSSFSHAFKKVFGCYPREIKNNSPE